MFDHIKFGVTDYAASKTFFLKALEPLGVTIVQEGPPTYGIELSPTGGKASLCFYQAEEKPAPLHLAFTAQSRPQVEAFYRAAMEAGATDNGAPELCPDYHANYYAAFVIGPDGHNIEVVCHQPENVMHRSLDVFRGHEVVPRSWDDIARFYREEPGGSFVAMLPLVDTLQNSAAAGDLWAFTSMHTLAISDSADHRTGDCTLYISYRPTERTFEFHHHSFSGHEDCMTCSEHEALHALHTFLEYKFGVLLEEPV